MSSPLEPAPSHAEQQGDEALAPALLHLATYQSPGARRDAEATLTKAAQVLTGGRATGWRDMEWVSVRYADLAKVCQQLSVADGPEAANGALWVLRGVIGQAHFLGHVPAEDYLRAVTHRPLAGAALRRGTALEPWEIAELFRCCAEDASATGPRDAALLALHIGAGLGRSQAVGMQLEDLDLEARTLRVRDRHAVSSTHLVDGADMVLSDWLAIRGDAAGVLVCAVGADRPHRPIRSITAQTAYFALKARGQSAGIRPFTVRDLQDTHAYHFVGAASGDRMEQRDWQLPGLPVFPSVLVHPGGGRQLDLFE